MVNTNLTNSYTINLDDDTSEKLELIAKTQQRKPRELLRIYLLPIINQKYKKALIDLKYPIESIIE